MAHYLDNKITNGFSCIRFLRQHKVISSCLLFCFASCAFAQQQSDTGQTEQNDPFAGLPPEVREKAVAHETCVNQVMASFERVAVKRTQIAENCKAERDTVVETFPEEVRQLMATNLDRRVEQVLYALEQIEGTTVDTATDVQEIVEELDSLAEESSATE